jgi:hypothetical protein
MADDAHESEKTVTKMVFDYLYQEDRHILARISPNALAEYLHALVGNGYRSPLNAMTVIELLPYCVAWQREYEKQRLQCEAEEKAWEEAEEKAEEEDRRACEEEVRKILSPSMPSIEQLRQRGFSDAHIHAAMSKWLHGIGDDDPEIPF